MANAKVLPNDRTDPPQPPPQPSPPTGVGIGPFIPEKAPTPFRNPSPISYQEQLARLAQILEAGEAGHIFRIVFRRRTPKLDPVTKAVLEPAGSLRTMVARLNVTSRLSTTNPMVEGLRQARNLENQLITVFEMDSTKGGYKTIPLDSIVSVNEEPPPAPAPAPTPAMPKEAKAKPGAKKTPRPAKSRRRANT